MRRLIVNADDFGLTRGVNRAIAELHHAGVLSSATLIANAAGVVNVTASGSRSLSGSPTTLTFAAPFDASDTQLVSLSGPLSAAASYLVANDTFTVTTLGIPFPSSLVTSQLTPILTALASQADTVVDGLLNGLGTSVAYMDVSVPYVRCSNPVLAQ